MDKASLADLEDLYQKALEQLLLRKHHVFQQSVTDEFVSPLTDNQVVSSIVEASYHTDDGRIAITTLRRIFMVAEGFIMYLLSFRANALLEFWMAQTDIADRDYATPVIILFSLLMVVVIYGSLAEQSMTVNVYETEQERTRLLLSKVGKSAGHLV